jgi:hypothetical protein
MKKLLWYAEKRRVKELKTWSKNPRKITKQNFANLKKRITQRGFHDVVKIDTDNTVLSGNQRKKALLELGIKEVTVLIPSRKLTDDERNKIALESNIYLILQNPYYYGVFEYPVKSDNWYTGKHIPLITKEIFDQVQSQVKSNVLRAENKEFAFTKLMVCGLCGSGITADEKFKKLKNGSVKRHVYYKCATSKDRNCKLSYTNEEDLIKQFEQLIEKVDLDEIGIKEKIKEEVARFKKFQKVLLGVRDIVEVGDIDIRNYAKYILREGPDIEKRELLGCFKSKITLTGKKVSLELH